ncbi:MAG: 2-hydroxychromene-2-carboxylate isomerase [Alphaproteobacteria bacterium]|jgi:2-hydroxychromene-2-carboxylate isomerase|nr:2-hydroxychromene-2-carboxylate isomerase [Alphaproteobacteria bacterium]
MSDPILFYFDFSSPYGYFAALKIDDLAAGFERDVIWRPMMLGAAMKVTGSKPLAEVEIKGDYCKHDWDRLSRFMGVPWTMPEKFPIASLAVSRAFYWLDDVNPEMAKRFALAAFDAYFGHGRDITDPDIVAELAMEQGIEPEGLLAAVQDPAVKQRLKDETVNAIEAGVFGSPYIIVDGEGFWGADRLWMVKRWLRSGGW